MHIICNEVISSQKILQPNEMNDRVSKNIPSTVSLPDLMRTMKQIGVNFQNQDLNILCCFQHREKQRSQVQTSQTNRTKQSQQTRVSDLKWVIQTCARSALQQLHDYGLTYPLLHRCPALRWIKIKILYYTTNILYSINTLSTLQSAYYLLCLNHI